MLLLLSGGRLGWLAVESLGDSISREGRGLVASEIL